MSHVIMSHVRDTWQMRQMRTSSRPVKCEECWATSGVRLREKTNPTNYHVERRRLCVKCASRLGYATPSR